MKTGLSLLLIAGIAAVAAGCDSVENDRIPASPVNIALSDAGSWNTYGVAGYGANRRFIPGPAATGSTKYGLKRYRCNPSGTGGFIITN